MLIFLDFDGVLHPCGKDVPHFCYKPLFEDTLRKCVNVSVVVTSTWRLAYSMKELKVFFSEDIGSRIIGVTPILDDDAPYSRYREISQYLEDKNQVMPWIAIDNEPDLFPKECNLIVTDSIKGFDEVAANKLEGFYGMCRSGS